MPRKIGLDRPVLIIAGRETYSTLELKEVKDSVKESLTKYAHYYAQKTGQRVTIEMIVEASLERTFQLDAGFQEFLKSQEQSNVPTPNRQRRASAKAQRQDDEGTNPGFGEGQLFDEK